MANLCMFPSNQVTAKGFAPLLQFAYTAKLVLSRENIQEVILCADFLGVHNLEDSCFQFLQAQLQSDDRHERKVKYEDDVAAEDESIAARQWTNDVATSDSPAADLPQCPKYRKYHYQVCHGKPNGESQYGGDDVVMANHVVASRALLTPSRIKEEQLAYEDEGGQANGQELCAEEEVLEMELELEGVPVAAEHSPSGGSPSSCLRSYLQRGGLDLSAVPGTTIQQLLTNRLSLNHYKELVKDRPRDKRDLKAHLADVVPALPTAKRSERPTSDASSSSSPSSSSKHEGELDRCSVIFSSAVGDRQLLANSYIKDKFRETVSNLMQVEDPSAGSGPALLSGSCPVAIKTSTHSSPPPSEAQTSSSRSSFSYQEDPEGSGSSPSNLPHFDFSSQYSGSASGLPLCLGGGGTGAGEEQRQTPCGRDVVFSQGCTKIKSEQSFGASGGNSSDDSGSFSEGDSESGISRVIGPEVSVALQWSLCPPPTCGSSSRNQ